MLHSSHFSANEREQLKMMLIAKLKREKDAKNTYLSENGRYYLSFSSLFCTKVASLVTSTTVDTKYRFLHGTKLLPMANRKFSIAEIASIFEETLCNH